MSINLSASLRRRACLWHISQPLRKKKKVAQPNSNRKLGSLKFEQRIADKPSAPIRAFASEVLSLVPALALMCDVVLGGFDPLREHAACWQGRSQQCTWIGRVTQW